MKPAYKLWTFDKPLVLAMSGVLLLITGPLFGIWFFFEYAWDKPGLLAAQGWTSDIAVYLVQANFYYSFFALAAGPALIMYAFIQLVVIIVKKLKSYKQ